jgi:putative transposase
MLLQGGLGIERMCLLVGVSRASFYRYLRTQYTCDEEMLVRSEIQRIALAHQGRYGYRRMTAELRRRGMLVNHKRIARIMREDNLIGTQMQFVRSFRAAGARRNLYQPCSPNEAYWHESAGVADITFIRLKREFVYLAVLLDRFSRKVVGWNLDRTLTARLPLMALENALKERRPAVERPNPSVRNRMLEYFFNRLMHRDLDCFRMPRPQSRIGPCRISGKH